LEDKFTIVYAITEKGPDIVHSNSSTLPNSKLQEIALYHLLLVAQGTWHHTGLFLLPLPIEELRNNHKAIYYGFLVKDPDQKDPRTKGTRYGCCVISCGTETIGMLNLRELEEIFRNFFIKFDSYQIIKQKPFFNKIEKLINKNIYQKKKNNEINNLNSVNVNHIKV